MIDYYKIKEEYLVASLGGDLVDAPLEGHVWEDIQWVLKEMEADGHVEVFWTDDTRAKYRITKEGLFFFHEGGYPKEQKKMNRRDRLVEWISSLINAIS